MFKQQSNKILDNYFIGLIVNLLKKIRLSFSNQFSLYDLLELYIIGIVKGALTTRASSITLSFFMAIFPFVIFIIAIIPYIPVENFRSDFFNFLDSVLPPTTSEFFVANIFDNIYSSDNGGLLSTTFLISLFLMANGINSIFYGFQNSFHPTLNRNFFKQYIISLIIAVVFSLILIFSILTIGFINIYIINNLELYGLIEISQATSGLILVKNVFIISMVYTASTTLYYMGVKDNNYSKIFSVGAIMTTVLILLNSKLFSIYITNFSSYNELYGSIGALLVLLFYIWLNANILLLGFELNASINFIKKSSK